MKRVSAGGVIPLERSLAGSHGEQHRLNRVGEVAGSRYAVCLLRSLDMIFGTFKHSGESVWPVRFRPRTV